MKVTITIKHLNKAIKAKKQAQDEEKYGVQCLIGQVAQETYGPEFQWCFSESIKVGEKQMPLSKKVQKLVCLFDNHDYKSIRELLPTTVQLPRA